MTDAHIINYSLGSLTQVSDMYSSQSEDLSRLLCKKNEVVVNDNGQSVIASYIKRKVVNSSVETVIMI